MPSSAAGTPEAPPPARRLRMVVQYDGTAYVGWERQKNGLAVQEVLEEAIFRITRERVVLEGSGRTDAGVHARAQQASFGLDHPIHPRKLLLGINALSAADVSVLSLEEAPADFHARKSATSKWYRYTILNDGSRRPLISRTSYHFPQRLDPGRMSRAAAALVGTHDFTAFTKEAWRKKSRVRTLLEVRVLSEGPLIMVDLLGTGFLYNMVRIVVGTLIEVGLGKRPEEEVGRLLDGGPRERAGFTAPPEGLCLMEVRYGEDPPLPAPGVGVPLL